MSNAHTAYADLACGVRLLGGALTPALAVQFEAPPGARSSGNRGGVPNPTLDTVMDPRRLALSEEIRTTVRVMRQAKELLDQQTEALCRAIARWEGTEGGYDQ